MSRKKLYLPFADWPPQDQADWTKAFKPGVELFDDCGPGAHVRGRTKLALEYSYGKFLAFVADCRPELLPFEPADRLSRKIIEDFVGWQPSTCGDVTLGNYLNHLRMVLGFFNPDMDWSWLSIIQKRIAARAKGKRERYHLVTSETLYSLGLDLMDRALNNPRRPAMSKTMLTMYRDGLMIAVLALTTLRRSTFAALRIGKQLVRCGKVWDLDIPAEEMKNNQPFECSILERVSKHIDFYLEQVRPRLMGTTKHDHFWTSSRGPMGDRMIYKAVRRRTHKAFGFPVNLHRFRHAAPTFLSMRDPENVQLSKDVLGDTWMTTRKFYLMTQTRLAARAFARLVDEIKTGS